MERRKSELLDDVIMRFMRQSGLEMPLNQYRLIQSWADVAGQLVAEQTKEIFIRNQTLYVRVTSPAMRANLMMNRTRLTSLLNKQVGADVITNIALMYGLIQKDNLAKPDRINTWERLCQVVSCLGHQILNARCNKEEKTISCNQAFLLPPRPSHWRAPDDVEAGIS